MKRGVIAAVVAVALSMVPGTAVRAGELGHCDPTTSSYLRCVVDEECGQDPNCVLARAVVDGVVQYVDECQPVRRCAEIVFEVAAFVCDRTPLPCRQP